MSDFPMFLSSSSWWLRYDSLWETPFLCYLRWEIRKRGTWLRKKYSTIFCIECWVNGLMCSSSRIIASAMCFENWCMYKFPITILNDFNSESSLGSECIAIVWIKPSRMVCKASKFHFFFFISQGEQCVWYFLKTSQDYSLIHRLSFFFLPMWLLSVVDGKSSCLQKLQSYPDLLMSKIGVLE